MSILPKPHGGKLIQAFNPEYDVINIKKELEIDAIALSDLELIAVGLFSPLTGFLVLIPRQEVVFLDIATEDAIRLLVSGGVLNPISPIEKD